MENNEKIVSDQGAAEGSQASKGTGGVDVPRADVSPPGLESESTSGTQRAHIINEDIIRESLQSVVDPEIGFSIVDLGLIYDVHIDDEANVAIRMTLTSPACPVGPEILASAHMAALNTPGVKNVKVDLVWDPPWDPRVHATEDIKLEFGIL